MDTPIFLIADSNARFLEKSEGILREAGYRMMAAPDGLEAKAALSQGDLTGVLAHMQLSRLDGIALCRYIKEQHDPELPVILMSPDEPDAVALADDAGADNVLFRPVKRTELLFAARSMVQLRSLSDSRPTSEAGASSSAKAAKSQGEGAKGGSRLSQFEFFKAFLAVEIKRSRRYGFPLSLMLTSLDGVDDIEQRHGDRVLRQLLSGLARAIRRSVRDIDIPVSLRDDTVLVLMPHTDAEGAQSVAERVRQRIRRSVYREGDLVIRPTISIGTTTHAREKDRNFSQVMRRASTAMREAARKGGDCVVVQ